MPQATNPSASGYTHSLRVTISLAQGKVQVLHAMRVAMKALAPPPAAPTKESTGYWFEVRDQEGKLLYHRPLPHGDMESVEVFDEEGGIRRVASSNPERKIDLIIPDFPHAAELTLHGPARREERMKPSAVLNRVPMEHLRSLAQSGGAK